LDARRLCNLGLFLGEGADEPGSGEVLLGLRRDLGEHGLDALESFVNSAPHELHQNAGEGHGSQRGQGEEGADAQQEIERSGEEEYGVGGVHDRRTEEHAHRVQVVGHAGHDVAGTVFLVVRGRLLLELSEEIVAQIEFDVARNADDDPAHEEEENAVEDGDGHDEAGVAEDLVPCDTLRQVVGSEANDMRKLHPDDIGKNGAEAAPEVSAPVAAHVREQGLEILEH
jgi:hypothetical protein